MSAKERLLRYCPGKKESKKKNTKSLGVKTEAFFLKSIMFIEVCLSHGILPHPVPFIIGWTRITLTLSWQGEGDISRWIVCILLSRH